MAEEPAPAPPPLPSQSPFFHAQQADRYDRQELIKQYQEEYDCQLLVMIDALLPDSVTPFEDLLYSIPEGTDVHLMLHSPGGDGETALRLVQATQTRCDDLTVVVPDQAKSAATLLAVGAHEIMMGPMSDLGPVDPQFPRYNDQGQRYFVSAKDIIAAYDEALDRVSQNENTYPVVAALLGNLDALDIQRARSSLRRTADQLQDALRCCPDRTEEEVEELAAALEEPLIQAPAAHTAVFNAADADAAGLPINEIDPRSRQWQMLWRLYTKYYRFVQHNAGIYEGDRVSHTVPPQQS